MKRILVNAAQEEELRVALVDGQRLYDLDIETPSKARKKANIYKGKVTRVEPSLEAAFVDFGASRHGFLPWKEISEQYREENGKTPIREGAEVIVQVEKEERGNKGAALSTYISLAGRYLVLMPNNPRLGGISRRIEGDERTEAKEALRELEIPDNMGLIVRTAGVGKEARDLQWDLDYLLKLWQTIQQVGGERRAPCLIHEESNAIIRAIRDYLRTEIGEVLFDTKASWEEAMLFVHQVMPQYENRIKLYEEKLPLFNRFQIEHQIESAFGRNVTLPSGGTLSIDPTEALVAIDINSSRSTRGADINETALNTNLEAADEIARQLRLRDIGGLIVIDFIDMTSNQHQRQVENRMREALEADRARVQVSRISRFGLLEMSRQRLRASLDETSSIVCPRCSGQGRVRTVKSLALSIIRIVREEAAKDKNREIRIDAPLEVAAFLLNEKREEIATIEGEGGSSVTVLPAAELVTPHYRITGVSGKGEQYEVDHTEMLDAEIEVDTPSSQPAVSRDAIAQARERPPAAQPIQSVQPVQQQQGPVASLVSAVRGLFGGGRQDEAETTMPAEEPKPARGKAAGGRAGESRGKSDGRRQSQGRGRSEGRSRGGSRRRDRDRDRNEQSQQAAQQGAQRQGTGTAEEPREGAGKESSGRGGRQRQAAGRDGRRQAAKKTQPEAAQAETATAGENVEEAQSTSAKPRRRPAAKRPRNTAQRKRGPRTAAVDESQPTESNDTTAVEAAAAPTVEAGETPAAIAVETQAAPDAGSQAATAAETQAAQAAKTQAEAAPEAATADVSAAADGADADVAATAPATETMPDATAAVTDAAAQPAEDAAPEAEPQVGAQSREAGAVEADAEETKPKKTRAKSTTRGRRTRKKAAEPAAAEQAETPDPVAESESKAVKPPSSAEERPEGSAQEPAEARAGDEAGNPPPSVTAEQTPLEPDAATAASPDTLPEAESAAAEAPDAEAVKAKRTRKSPPARKRPAKTAQSKKSPAEESPEQDTGASAADPSPQEPAGIEGGNEVSGEPQPTKPARTRTRAKAKKPAAEVDAASGEAAAEAKPETQAQALAEPRAAAESESAGKSEPPQSGITVAETETAPTTQGRAPNDPREVRRRQREEKATPSTE